MRCVLSLSSLSPPQLRPPPTFTRTCNVSAKHNLPRPAAPILSFWRMVIACVCHAASIVLWTLWTSLTSPTTAQAGASSARWRGGQVEAKDPAEVLDLETRVRSRTTFWFEQITAEHSTFSPPFALSHSLSLLLSSVPFLCSCAFMPISISTPSPTPFLDVLYTVARQNNTYQPLRARPVPFFRHDADRSDQI